MKLSVFTRHLVESLGTRDAFKVIRDAGFDGVDYTLDEYYKNVDEVKRSKTYRMSDNEIIDRFGEVKRLADEVGLTVFQTHSMFGPFETCDSEEYFDCVRKNLLATNVLKSKYTVVHPIQTPDGQKSKEGAERRFQYNLAFYRRLLPYLKEYDVVNGVEPMWAWTEGPEKRICATVCSKAEEILRFIKELGDEHFCACPDVGHFALVEWDTGDSVKTALEKLGDKVKIVHVHEVDGARDSHTKPFSFDKFPWDDILEGFKNIGFDGAFNFETTIGYTGKYPKELLPSAVKHLGDIGRYMIEKIKG